MWACVLEWVCSIYLGPNRYNAAEQRQTKHLRYQKKKKKSQWKWQIDSQGDRAQNYLEAENISYTFHSIS